VSAFSTAGERRLVAAGRPPTGPRLARVAAAMARLADRIDDLDPGIMPASSPAADGVIRGDLLRVRSVEIDAGTGQAWVYLDALRLDPPASTTLVSRFDELGTPEGNPTLTVDQLLAAAGAQPVVSHEIHRWRWADGGWRRDRATRHLLGEPVR
jgi:hypothetical protein